MPNSLTDFVWRLGQKTDKLLDRQWEKRHEKAFSSPDHPQVLPSNAEFEDSTSLFFTKLPFEIRQIIYSYIFIKQIIHIDLERKSRREPQINSEFAAHSQDPTSEFWRVQSYVCYRDRARGNHDFFNDPCPLVGYQLMGHTAKLERQPVRSKYPDPNEIGVLDWLSTCRQAYLETIDLFYNNKTLHIKEINMAFFPPKLLLPQRFKHIRNIELRWPCDLPMVWVLPESSERTRLEPKCAEAWRDFEHAIDCLPKTFPSLRSLRLSLEYEFHDMTIPNDFAILESKLYPQLDLIAKGYQSQLYYCEIALPAAVQLRLQYRAGFSEARQGRIAENIEREPRRRFRRSVQKSNDEQESIGYWISRGYGEEHGMRMILETW